MFLPKGNPLIEDITLNYTDINVLIGNLEQEGFSGYITFDYGEGLGVFFFLHGGLVNTLEKVTAPEEKYAACVVAKFFNRIRKKETKVSVYVLTPNICSVLSNVHLFKPVYKDYEAGKKEMMLLCNEIEEKSYTGFLSALGDGGVSYILFEKGKFIIDNFAIEVGQILCSSEKIHVFLDKISAGGRVYFYAEAQEVIENKKKEIQNRLNKIKQLIIKGETRFLGKANVARIDEYIVKEWATKTPVFMIDLETNDGKKYTLEATQGKKMGGYVGLASSFIKKMGLREGDLVNVNPVG